MDTVSAVPRALRVALLSIAWFSVVSCAIGFVMAVFLDGAGVPREWLDGTGFTSFVWPGIVLGVVVGGSQALALVAQHGRFRLAWGLHAAAGLIMMTWIFVEIALMLVWSPLQGVYFATGLLQTALAVLALGAWPRPFVARERRTAREDGHPVPSHR